MVKGPMSSTERVDLTGSFHVRRGNASILPSVLPCVGEKREKECDGYRKASMCMLKDRMRGGEIERQRRKGQVDGREREGERKKTAGRRIV